MENVKFQGTMAENKNARIWANLIKLTLTYSRV